MNKKFASVCSGVGLFELAALWNDWEPVFTSEIKPYCQQALQKRYPTTTHYGDFTTKSFRAIARKYYRSRLDVLAAGLPCQPFSVAGLKKGQMDERHLGPAFVSLCATIRPPWVCVENVAGFVKMALDDFTSAMEAQGYACQAFVLPAAAVGAPHRRDRVWIICYNAAYAHSLDRRKQRELSGRSRTGSWYQPGRCAADVANAYRARQPQPKRIVTNIRRRARNGNKTKPADSDGQRCENGLYGSEPKVYRQANQSTNRLAGFYGWHEHWYEVAARVCGMDDGHATGLDGFGSGSGYLEYSPSGRNLTARLEAGGNGLVAQVAYEIFRAIDLYKAELQHE